MGSSVSIFTWRIRVIDPIANAVMHLPEPTQKGYLQQSLCIDTIRCCLLRHRLGCAYHLYTIAPHLHVRTLQSPMLCGSEQVTMLSQLDILVALPHVHPPPHLQ